MKLYGEVIKMDLNNFEIKLSYLKQIDKHNVYVLHLTSYQVLNDEFEDNVLVKTDIDTENLDGSSRQVLGIYLMPRRKHRKIVLAITPRKCVDIQKIYKKLDKVNGLVDITPYEGNEEHVELYEKLKNEYYDVDVDEFINQKFDK
jgi:hypothetical protein